MKNYIKLTLLSIISLSATVAYSQTLQHLDTVQAIIIKADGTDNFPIRAIQGFAVYDTKSCQPVAYLSSRKTAFRENWVYVSHEIRKWRRSWEYLHDEHWPLICAAGTVYEIVNFVTPKYQQKN